MMIIIAVMKGDEGVHSRTLNADLEDSASLKSSNFVLS